MAASSIVLPKAKFELEFAHGSAYSEEDREAILRVFEASAPSCGSEGILFPNFICY